MARANLMQKIQFQHTRVEYEEHQPLIKIIKKKQAENNQVTRIIELIQLDEFERQRVAELVCAIIAFISIVGSWLAQDITFTDESLNKDGWDYIKLIGTQEYVDMIITWLLICQSLYTVMLEISIIWRTYRNLQWRKTRREFLPEDTILSSGLYKALLVELLINLFHPILPFKEKKFYMYNTMLGADIQYKYNDPLDIFILIRLYHLLSVTLQISKYSGGRAQRVCDMNSHKSSPMFTLRCLMVEMPNRIVIILMLITIIVFGYALHICERSHWNIPDPQTGMDFGNLSNSMWCVIVTFTTVGYGDFYPLTNPGRIIIFADCLWGVILVSLMVVSVTNTLEMNSSEKRTFVILKKLKSREDIKPTAALIISLAGKIKLLMKKKENVKKIAQYIGLFIKAKSEFKKHRQQISNFEMQEMSQKVTSNDVGEIRLIIEQMQKTIESELRKIKKKFKNIILKKKKATFGKKKPLQLQLQ